MSERVTCPHCHQLVELAETCSNCGQPLQADLQTLVDEPVSSSSTSETPIADSAEPTLEPTSEEQVEVVAEPEVEPDQLEEEPMSAKQETVEGIEEPAAAAAESTSKKFIGESQLLVWSSC
jgi:hypothetical protein